MPERVYVSEYGYGGKPGTVLRRYHNGTADRVVVQLDTQECPRDCFASSVFDTREEADRASIKTGF